MSDKPIQTSPQSQPHVDETDPLLALPWYVTGKLSHEEAAELEQALAAREDKKHLLAVAREEQEETVRLNESLGAPSPDVLAKVMAGIENTPQEHTWRQRIGKLLGGWDMSWAPFRAPAVRLAAAGALAVVLIQGAVIGWLMTGQEGPAVYETASQGQVTSKASDYRFLVAFSDEAKMADIRALLQEKNGRIVSGPRGNGLFLLAFPATDPKDGMARDRLLAELRKQTALIRFVAPAAD